jgi:predicted XRE-type DNA-binding protein
MMRERMKENVRKAMAVQIEQPGVEQRLMVMLWILAQGETQRNTAHKFQISQSTVSEIVDQMLPKLVSLHKTFVRLPEDGWIDPNIELDPKFNAFNGCIGSIDGMHFAVHIPLRKQTRWRDRDGNVSQNVFAAVRSDASFSYVLAGAEGSINDALLCV